MTSPLKRAQKTSLKAFLRPMISSDLDWVREVRNSDHVREGARLTGFISAEAHQEWWLLTAHCDRFIFEWNGEKAGVIVKGGNDYWSFYLDSRFTGQGLGFIMLALYISYYKGVSERPLKAHVKKRNVASIKLHHKLGFKRVRSTNPELLEYRLDVTS